MNTLPSHKNRKIFNINNNIYVKLNDAGYQVLLDYKRETHDFLSKCRQHSKQPEFITTIDDLKNADIDNEGYRKFQMWTYLSIFGPHTYVTSDLHDVNVMFDINHLSTLTHTK